MNEYILSLRDKGDNDSYNYLVNYGKSIGAPKPSGCACKESNRLRYNKVFFEYYDNYILTNG